MKLRHILFVTGASGQAGGCHNGTRNIHMLFWSFASLSNYGPTVVLFGTGQTDSQMASDLAAEYDVNIAHAGVHKLINVKNVSNKNVIEYAWDVAKKDTHSYLYRHLVGAEFAAVKGAFY